MLRPDDGQAVAPDGPDATTCPHHFRRSNCQTGECVCASCGHHFESPASSDGPDAAHLKQIRETLETVRRAIGAAFCGSAEHGAFLRGGGGEYVPSPFMVINALGDLTDEHVAALRQQLAEQRAELAGRLSEQFQSIPESYDTPTDHYREMARRLVDDRDALKHANRALQQQLAEAQRALALAYGERNQAETDRDDALGCAEALAGMWEAMGLQFTTPEAR